MPCWLCDQVSKLLEEAIEEAPCVAAAAAAASDARGGRNTHFPTPFPQTQFLKQRAVEFCFGFFFPGSSTYKKATILCVSVRFTAVQNVAGG